MGFDYCHILNGRKLTHVQKMTLQAPFISLFPYCLSSNSSTRFTLPQPTQYQQNKLARSGHTQESSKAKQTESQQKTVIMELIQGSVIHLATLIYPNPWI